MIRDGRRCSEFAQSNRSSCRSPTSSSPVTLIVVFRCSSVICRRRIILFAHPQELKEPGRDSRCACHGTFNRTSRRITSILRDPQLLSTRGYQSRKIRTKTRNVANVDAASLPVSGLSEYRPRAWTRTKYSNLVEIYRWSSSMQETPRRRTVLQATTFRGESTGKILLLPYA